MTLAAIERISHGLLLRRTSRRTGSPSTRSARASGRKWRAGRIFLAGDAAHQAPPLFGQGLCAGMRDVANLTWKLRLVIRGLAGDDLLDMMRASAGPTCVTVGEQAWRRWPPRCRLETTKGGWTRRLHPRAPECRAQGVVLGPACTVAWCNRRRRLGTPSPTGLLYDWLGPRFLVAAEASLMQAVGDAASSALGREPGDGRLH